MPAAEARTSPAQPVSSDTMERKWRGRRVGDATDAAALCGISKDTYQYYVKRLGAPAAVKGYRDPETGYLMYDLDKVEAWQAARPGRGARTDLDRVEG